MPRFHYVALFLGIIFLVYGGFFGYDPTIDVVLFFSILGSVLMLILGWIVYLAEILD